MMNRVAMERRDSYDCRTIRRDVIGSTPRNVERNGIGPSMMEKFPNAKKIVLVCDNLHRPKYRSF